jgi:glycosyltransferase 2 family protein
MVNFRMKNWVGWAVRLVFSTFCLILVFRIVDFRLFVDTMLSVNLFWLTAAILLFFPSQMISAYRWYYILCNLGQYCIYRSVLRINIVGQIAALFLPGQISGDIVRGFMVTRGKEDKGVLVFSIVLDKIVMLLVIAGFATIGSFQSTVLKQYIYIFWISMGLFLFTCIALLVVILYQRMKFRPPIQYIVLNKLDRFMSPIKKPVLEINILINTLLLAVLFQGLSVTGSYILAKSMSINVALWDWLIISSIVAVIQLIPISLGGLGVREGAFAAILSLYGIPISQSTAFSLIGFVLGAVLLLLMWIIINIMDYWSTKISSIEDDRIQDEL